MILIFERVKDFPVIGIKVAHKIEIKRFMQIKTNSARAINLTKHMKHKMDTQMKKSHLTTQLYRVR